MILDYAKFVNWNEKAQKLFFWDHCDPRELFIDAWWIDTDLKILL